MCASSIIKEYHFNLYMNTQIVCSTDNIKNVKLHYNILNMKNNLYKSITFHQDDIITQLNHSFISSNTIDEKYATFLLGKILSYTDMLQLLHMYDLKTHGWITECN